MLSTLEKVKKLETYLAVGNSTVDPVLDMTINKLLSREVNRLIELKARLSTEIVEFEKRYNIKTDTFLQRYEAGELGDAMDFIEWASTFEMISNVKQKLELLQSVNKL